MLYGKVLRIIGLATSGIAALYMQPLRPVVISGNSMEPTYQNWEFAISTKEVSEIKKGDIVIVKNGRGTFLKRVAFMPGESVLQFRQSNGEWTDLIRVQASENARKRLRELRVPLGHYYVLGDNLTMSVDSREFGPISRDQIIGKVVDPRAWPDGSKPLATAPVAVAKGSPSPNTSLGW